jgi:predicted nucleic acid-binding Zn ribbon protein
VGQALDDLLAERGWQDDSAIARLVTRWSTVVGSELADHVHPVSFRDGVLLLQAESTAWATQVRLLLPDLRRVVDAEVGTGVVASISVVGPASPSWVKGPRTVKGRGPRDTYG